MDKLIELIRRRLEGYCQCDERDPFRRELDREVNQVIICYQKLREIVAKNPEQELEYLKWFEENR